MSADVLIRLPQEASQRSPTSLLDSLPHGRPSSPTPFSFFRVLALRDFEWHIFSSTEGQLTKGLFCCSAFCNSFLRAFLSQLWLMHCQIVHSVKEHSICNNLIMPFMVKKHFVCHIMCVLCNVLTVGCVQICAQFLWSVMFWSNNSSHN